MRLLTSRLLLFALQVVWLAGCEDEPEILVIEDPDQSATTPPPARAGFGGLDLVLVIDQSGSMYGDRVSGPNDRLGKRTEAAWAAASGLNESARGTEFVHRMSIIEYGTDAVVTYSALRIADNPQDPHAQGLLGSIGSNVRPRDMVWTDTLEALERAADELELMAGDTVGLPPGARTQAVLLLTDGRPEVSGGDDAYLGRLDALVRDPARLPPDRLWVLGLSDRDNYWDEWEGEWVAMTGDSPPGTRVSPVSSAESIKPRIKALVTDWVGGAPGPGPKDSWLCPPYLKSVVFDIDLAAPGDSASVEIRDPDGAQVTDQSATFLNSRRSLKVVVDRPGPGVWHLRNPADSSYSVTPDPLYNEIRMDEPVTPRNVGVPVDFRFRVWDDQNTPFTLDPAYPVQANMYVVDPDGSKHTVPIAMEADGSFASTSPYVPDQSGDHEVYFGGHVEMDDEDGAPTMVEVFQTRPPLVHTLVVTDQDPLTLVVDSPTVDDGVGLTLGEGTIELRGHLGTPDDPTGAGLDPAVLTVQGAWFVQPVDAHGRKLNDPVALAWDGTAFSADLPVALDPWSLAWLTRQGEVALQFRVDRDSLQPEWFLRSVEMAAGDSDAPRLNWMTTPMVPVHERFMSWLAAAAGVVGLPLLLLVLAWVMWRRLSFHITDRFIERWRPEFVLRNLEDLSEDQTSPISRRVTHLDGRSFRIRGQDDWVPSRLRVERIRTARGRLSVQVEYVPPVRPVLPPDDDWGLSGLADVGRDEETDETEALDPTETAATEPVSPPRTIRAILTSEPGSRHQVQGLDGRFCFVVKARRTGR